MCARVRAVGQDSAARLAAACGKHARWARTPATCCTKRSAACARGPARQELERGAARARARPHLGARGLPLLLLPLPLLLLDQQLLLALDRLGLHVGGLAGREVCKRKSRAQ